MWSLTAAIPVPDPAFRSFSEFIKKTYDRNAVYGRFCGLVDVIGSDSDICRATDLNTIYIYDTASRVITLPHDGCIFRVEDGRQWRIFDYTFDQTAGRIQTATLRMPITARMDFGVACRLLKYNVGLAELVCLEENIWDYTSAGQPGASFATTCETFDITHWLTHPELHTIQIRTPMCQHMDNCDVKLNSYPTLQLRIG